MVASITVEETQLFLKIAFIVLLYLFIWRVVRTASRDLRAPQESMVLSPRESRRHRQAIRHAESPEKHAGRLVVVHSAALPEGSVRLLNSKPLTIGRSSMADVILDGDEYASTRHARVSARSDGVWVEDAGSTNGTFVNGTRLVEPRRLRPGDVIRIGETDFRFEP
jgi:hypothetical protein